MSDIHTFFKPVEERYKTVTIAYHLMWEFIFNNRVKDGKIYSLKIDGLPEGTKIQAMAIDPMRMAVHIRLYHPSWPIVEPTAEIPNLGLQMTQTVFEVIEHNGYHGKCRKEPEVPYFGDKVAHWQGSTAHWEPEAAHQEVQPKRQGYEFL